MLDKTLSPPSAKRSKIDDLDAGKETVIIIDDDDTAEKNEVDAVFLESLKNCRIANQTTVVTSLIKQQPNSKRKTSRPSITNGPVIRIRSHSKFFSYQQEEELSKFVRDASDYYNGMTSKDVRILAFVYGVCNQVDLPIGWRDKHEASLAWCSTFTKRNKLSLSVTVAEQKTIDERTKLI